MKKTLETLEAADLKLGQLRPLNETTKGTVEQLSGEVKALIHLCQLDANAAIQININWISDRVNDLIEQVNEENIYS